MLCRGSLNDRSRDSSVGRAEDWKSETLQPWYPTEAAATSPLPNPSGWCCRWAKQFKRNWASNMSVIQSLPLWSHLGHQSALCQWKSICCSHLWQPWQSTPKSWWATQCHLEVFFPLYSWHCSGPYSPPMLQAHLYHSSSDLVHVRWLPATLQIVWRQSQGIQLHDQRATIVHEWEQGLQFLQTIVGIAMVWVSPNNWVMALMTCMSRLPTW